MIQKTHWPRIWIAFLGGCFAAFQIGKAIASLPLIIDELGLNLIQAGLILSLFTLISAITGAGMGLLADRIGHLYTAITGLIISACGAFLGSLSVDIVLLLSSRLIEGFGFILAIVSFPSLISRSATVRDRPLVMGLWGAFMPAGIGLSMLITPMLLDWHGWRGLWNDVGVFILFWAAILFLAFRNSATSEKSTLSSADLLSNLFKPGPLLVVIGFICYSSLYQSVTAFLPTILVSDYQMELDQAAYFGALVIIGNIIGNVSAGWLIGRGTTVWKILALSFMAMMICAMLVFTTFTSPTIKILGGFLFSAFGGLFPGTAFVLAARFAASPGQMALIAGLMLQGAGIGQTGGTLMVSSLVEVTGSWNYANLIVFIMAGVGLYCAWLMRSRS